MTHNKKMTLSFLLLGSAVAVSAVVISALGNHGYNFAFALPNDWGIVVSKDNNVALTSDYSNVTGNVKTNHDNNVGLSFTNAKSATNAVATLSSTGAIENTTLIKGIQSITVDFTGSLSVVFSSDTVEFTTPEALTSGTVFSLAKTFDYFKLTAGAETTINEIVIKHACESRFTLDEDKIIEAEEFLLNTKHRSNDSNAHGGAYALAIDDCGQGMYFRYYAFEAGNRDVTVTYSTGKAGSYHTLFVNGHNYNVVYSQNTGWFGDSHVSADVTIQDVPFVLGWNELYLIKNGTGSDNPEYGGYAQVDYITVEGSQRRVDLSDFDMTSYVYNLEGEAAKWHWDSKSQRPNNWGSNFSLGYGLGEMNADNDGVEFNVKIAEAGTYALRPVNGGNKSLRVSIDSAAAVAYDFGAYTEWNDPVMAAANVCQVELTAGTHSINIIRNGSWFTFDKLVVEKVS